MGGRNRQTQAAGENDKQGRDQIRGESLAMIEASNFLTQHTEPAKVVILAHQMALP
jgi:hypothetical protein